MPESNELRYDLEESISPVSVDLRSMPQGELKTLASELLSTLGADGVAIAAAIPANPPYMICTVSCGKMAPPVGALLDVNSGISGQCVREKQMLHSSDTATDSRVDQEACSRLGIRSVVVSPILRDSSCIGILEVFSAQAEAFDETALTNIAEEAARAASLIKVEGPSVELEVPDPQERKERPSLFLVDKRGLLSESESIADEDLQENAAASGDGLAVPRFLSSSPAPAQPRRWMAFTAAVVATAVLGFVLIRYMNTSGSALPKKSSAPSEPNAHSIAQDTPTMSSLVSDAAPPVRILMAKAIAGNSAAQASLAEHYIAGNGVTRDRVKATVWYVIAGVRGDKEGSRSAIRIMQNLQPYEIDQVHFNLGIMFRDGIGTSRNLIAAYSWFTLAKAAGDVRATAAVLNLEQAMKPAEVAEGRRRAAAWIDSRRTSVQNSRNDLPSSR